MYTYIYIYVYDVALPALPPAVPRRLPDVCITLRIISDLYNNKFICL